MATTVKIQFLTGRYHATPWDAHPNEGVTEPFPAPWRILRALVAASYRFDPQPREQLTRLLNYLAQSPPSYRVPPSTEGHVRHSVPFEPKRKNLVQRRRLIDAFRCYGAPFSEEASVYVVWPVDLPEAERSLLAELCDRVPHIGRSEAWVQMSVEEESLEFEDLPLTAMPLMWQLLRQYHGLAGSLWLHKFGHNFPDAFPSEQSTVNLMTPLSPSELQGFLTGIKALNLKEKEKALLPKTVLEALDIDYVEVQKQGWERVPGSQFIGYYWNPTRSQSRRKQSQDSNLLPKFARFRIDAKILPPTQATLELTDQMHRALTKRSNGHPVFSGKNNGEPLKDGQSLHAKFLPEFDQRGRVVAVKLYARMGFDPQAIQAMYKLRRLGREGERHWYPSLEYVDQEWEEDWENKNWGQVWESQTPLVLPRWPKKPKDYLDNQVCKLLACEGFPTPDNIDILDSKECDRRFRRMPIYRPRQNYHRVWERRFWLRLTFAEEVQGPIAIGWNCHYGLGMFAPR